VLLEPGGILQWDEREVNVRVAPNGDGKSEAMEKLGEYMASMFKVMETDQSYVLPRRRSTTNRTNSCCSWVPKLDEVFVSQGLVNVRMDVHPIPRAFHVYNMELFFQTLVEAVLGIDRNLGPDAGDVAREKIKEAYEEHRVHGSNLGNTDLVVCVGRKAE